MEPLSDDEIHPPLPPFANSLRGVAPCFRFSWNLLFASVGLALTIKLFGPASLKIVEASGIHSLDDWMILLAALLASIAAHEAGHLGMALAVDFDVLGGSFGPVRAIRLHRTWSFQFSRNLFSGSVIAIPRSESNWRARMLAVVSAGPLATFVSGLAAGFLFVAHLIGSAEVAKFLAGFVELNFFLFVLGLFPNSAAARLANDARLFFSLLRNTPEANEILLYHLCSQLQIAGVRPREYPERMMRRLASVRARPEMSLVYATAIVQWATDRGDVRSADAWQKRALDLSDFCNLKLQNSALAASACFDLVFRDDIRAARSKFAEVQLSLLAPEWLRHRTAAAYLIAAGNIPAALAEIARARYTFPNRLPYFDFESALLASLHRKAIATQPEDLVSRSLHRVNGTAGM